ncbi:hypothetical protein V5L05_001309 [Enterobacter cloacae]
MSVKRYEVNGSSSIFENENGSLVDYDDYAALEARCAALAAENGQMLRLLTDISENHDEYVNQDEYLYAGVPMDYASEINAYVSRDVEAENPFKATDAFLAEVRAQGVEMFANNLESMQCHIEAKWARSFISEVISVKNS